MSGSFDMDYVPHLWGIFAAMDDPLIRAVVCMKGAQVAWSTALIIFILKNVDVSPCSIIGMFSTETAARLFSDEKLTTTVRETPAVRDKIDTTSSRRSGSRTLFKKFPGGFLKLVGSNSPVSSKSTPAKIIFVEEPDDSAESVNSQGDSIALLGERGKRMPGLKEIIGGTPALKGFSRVESAYDASDKRELPVACHECGEKQVLIFENVTWLESDSGPEHEIYGKALPETGKYACEHCSCTWDDYQRKENIRNTVKQAIADGDPMFGWVATKPFSGAAGFGELGELYSCLPGVGVHELVKDYLKALHRQKMGDENAMIVFINSKKGQPYEHGVSAIEADDLRDKKEDYAELVCPEKGLLVTIGIDVQHDRLAIIVRAWGRDNESWLLYWGEISASNTCIDEHDEVWNDLDSFVFQHIPHVTGGKIRAEAITIDCSDGMSSDAVYKWVRTRAKVYRHVEIMAGKGTSVTTDKEIFTTPSTGIDHNLLKKKTKADKHGVLVFIIGVNKGKDWLQGQLKLTVDGIGRFHYYKDVRDDYFDQMVAEVKVPHPSVRNRLIWQQRPGKPCEAWDCENYALHAARAKRVHLLKEHHWQALERRLKPVERTTKQTKKPATNNWVEGQDKSWL